MLETSVYDDRYMKTKITTYVDKVFIDFCSLIVSGDDEECESFRSNSIDLLLAYESKYLQVYLDNSAYKIVKTEVIDYFFDNIFESGK